MVRLTAKNEEDGYRIENKWLTAIEGGYVGEAADKLAVFENIYENLLAEQETLSAELATLREQGKTNSYKFKEKMGKKLLNSNTISLFKAYGLNA